MAIFMSIGFVLYGALIFTLEILEENESKSEVERMFAVRESIYSVLLIWFILSYVTFLCRMNRFANYEFKK